MKKVFTVFLLTLMSLVAVYASNAADNAPAPQSEEDETLTFTINVVTGDWEPVEGATVILFNESHRTDAQGKVVVDGIPMDSLEEFEVPYRVLKDGYKPYEGVIVVEGFECYGVATLEVADAPGYEEETLSFEISVVTGDWEPVEGATVVLLENQYTTDESGKVKVTGITDESLFGQEVPYRVLKDGYKPYEGVIVVEGFECYGVAVLEAAEAPDPEEETLSFEISVVTGDWEPVEGATVVLLDNQYTTDASGKVKVTGITDESLFGQEVPYRVLKDGYKPYEGVIVVEGFECYGVAVLEAADAPDPEEETLSFEISVVTGDWEPVEGATVVLLDNQYTTDASGKVKVTGITDESLFGQEVPYTVTKAGYKPYEGVIFVEGYECYGVATLVADLSGIKEIGVSVSDSAIYDLQGRRVAKPAAGRIYIVNGVKVRL